MLKRNLSQVAKNKYPEGNKKIKLTPEESSKLSGLETADRTKAVRKILAYTPKKYPAGSQAWKDENQKFEDSVKHVNKGDRFFTNTKGTGMNFGVYDPSQLTSNIEYNQGTSGIHIKPENRGKFTAYKERTGSTTEEALHSPNAHVRQMANFANNAAKWKHEDGSQSLNTPNGQMKKMKSTKYGLGTEELGGGKPKTAKQLSEESKRKRAAAMGKKADNIDDQINQTAIDASKNEYGMPKGDQEMNVPKRKDSRPVPKFKTGKFAQGTKAVIKKDPLAGAIPELGNKGPKDPMIEKEKAVAKSAAPTPALGEKKEIVAPKIAASSKPSYDHLNFGQAFNTARKAGGKTFEWKGKKYTTQTKEEASTAKTSTPSNGLPKYTPPTLGSKGSTAIAKAESEAAHQKTEDMKKESLERLSKGKGHTERRTSNTFSGSTLAEAHKEVNPNSKEGTKIATVKKSTPAKKSIGSLGGPVVDAMNAAPGALYHAAKQAAYGGFEPKDGDDDDKEEGILSKAGKVLKKTMTGGIEYKAGTKKMKKGGKNMGC